MEKTQNETTTTLADANPLVDVSSAKTVEEDGHTKEQNVSYITDRTTLHTDINNDLGSFNSGIKDQAPLMSTLNRPVKIHEISWTVGSDPVANIDPWNLWQSDDFVKSKLSNFTYFRCNLKLRIVPSATQFLYGKLMFNYVPYGDDNEMWYNAYNVVRPAAVSNSEEAYLQYMSTYPITEMLDAASRNVIEITLPFIYHKNFLPINGDAGVNKVSLGKLVWANLNNLGKANPNASNNMNIAIFAWAEDFEMHVPTDFEPTSGKNRRKKRVTIKANSMVEEDETDQAVGGVLSNTASSIANIAGRLETAPFIGPFARATNIGATAVGGIARIFGFSNPVTIETPQPRVLRLFRNMATVDQPDTAVKLSLDSKQELSIDPRLCGLSSNDDMSIQAIASREQWITKGQWLGAVGNFGAPNTEVVCAAIVNPVACRITAPFGTTAKTATIMSPAGYLMRLFKYWRCSITYRIEVVCSDYHAGALQIQFDPMIKSAALVATDTHSTRTNTRQTIIMDIGDTRECEVTIDYVHMNVFQKDRDILSNTTAPSSYSDTVLNLETALNSNTDLGMLTVSVLNELTAPGDVTLSSATGAGVDVNIYMRCHNLEMGQPKGGWEDYLFVPTSGSSESRVSYATITKPVRKNRPRLHTSVLPKVKQPSNSFPICTQTDRFEPTSGSNVREQHSLIDSEENHDTLTCMGESVKSIRSLLKRPMQVYTDVVSTTAGNQADLATMFMPHFAPETIRGANRRLCYESFFSPAFLLKRGGMRWKTYVSINYYNAGFHNKNNGFLTIARQESSAPLSAASTRTAMNNPSKGTLLSLFPSGSQGMSITDLNYNPTVDVESPFYSNTRFALACNITNVSSGNSLTMNPTMDQILYMRMRLLAVGAGQAIYYTFASTGEDYNLGMFQAPPIIFTFV